VAIVAFHMSEKENAMNFCRANILVLLGKTEVQPMKLPPTRELLQFQAAKLIKLGLTNDDLLSRLPNPKLISPGFSLLVPSLPVSPDFVELMTLVEIVRGKRGWCVKEFKSHMIKDRIHDPGVPTLLVDVDPGSERQDLPQMECLPPIREQGRLALNAWRNFIMIVLHPAVLARGVYLEDGGSQYGQEGSLVFCTMDEYPVLEVASALVVHQWCTIPTCKEAIPLT